MTAAQGRLNQGVWDNVSDPLVAFLRGLALSAEDAAALAHGFGPPRALDRGEQLLREGDRPTALSVLCEGVAQAFRIVPAGGQQTLALFVPGDMLDACAFVLGTSDVAVCAITPIKIMQIPHARLEQLIAARPAIGRALWRRMTCDGAVLQEWMVGLGRRTAYAQLAHLMCEVSVRMQAVGMASGESCKFPLTQSELADVLGLSTVHVNRILQQLRGDGLIELARGWLTIKDEERLVEAGGFDPSYLGSRGRAFEETA